MTNAVLARMVCNSVEDYGVARKANLSPVYSSDPKSPNYSFSQATPQGKLELYITNPGAFEQFKAGKIYDMTITEYVAPAP